MLGALLGVALVGCGSDPVPDEAEAAPQSAIEPAPAGTDAYALRDSVVGAIEAAGGVRVSVTGAHPTTTVELVYDPGRQRFARRLTWGGGSEVMQLRTRQVCVNAAAAREIAALGNNVQGAVTGSEQPYSCTERGEGSVSGFVMFAYGQRDLVSRLAGLMGELSVDDLGIEPGDVPTRHVRLEATETGSGLRQVATTWDLWLDAQRRLVRATVTGLGDGATEQTATFDYGDVPVVTMPAAHGLLGFSTGSGIPGVGGMLAGQAGSTAPPAPAQ